MWRCFPLAVFLASLGGIECVGLGGCAKPKDLPDITVRATHAEELTEFRAELGARFTPEQLQPFDTAVDELQLDAMNRGVASAADREQDMLASVNGKTVHEALLLGWTARHNRFLREIAGLTKMLDHDLQQQQQTAATGTPESVTRRIGSEKEVLDQLRRNLSDTDQRLATWGATPGPSH
jgi:hypothetical protein